MDYLKWNNILASYFFNEQNAEKPVNLFITKEEIIKIGEPYFSEPDAYSPAWKILSFG